MEKGKKRRKKVKGKYSMVGNVERFSGISSEKFVILVTKGALKSDREKITTVRRFICETDSC